MSALDDDELRRHDDVCPICHAGMANSDSDEGVVVLTHCGHVFHSACILRWLYRSQKCPYCFTLLKDRNESDGAS